MKNEAKLNNDARRRNWVNMVMANHKLKGLLAADDGLVNEFEWKLRGRQREKEISENGFVNYR